MCPARKLSRPMQHVAHVERAFQEFSITELVNRRKVNHLWPSVVDPFLHECLYSVEEFTDASFIMERMNANLAQVIQVDWDHERISYLRDQILCVNKHLHSAGVFIEVWNRRISVWNLIVHWRFTISQELLKYPSRYNTVRRHQRSFSEWVAKKV